jgi:hypothetical protein
MNLTLFLKASFWTSLLTLIVADLCCPFAYAQSNLGQVRGETRDPGGLLPLGEAHVWAHNMDDGVDRTVISGVDGSFLMEGLKPGRYQLSATKEGFASSSRTTFDLAARQDLRIDVPLGEIPASAAAQKNGARWLLSQAD